MKKLSLLVLILLNYFVLYGQEFINGDFESNNSSICQFNISNADFNLIFTDVTGIGDREGLDFLRPSDCYMVGLPQSGNCFSSLETIINDSLHSSAISFRLTSILQSGLQYSISFYDRGLAISAPPGEIEIGVSDNDTAFGSMVGSTPPADYVWTKRFVTFTAPINGQYITVRQKHQAATSGEFVDNFSFDTTGIGINEGALNNSVELFPSPVTDRLNFTIRNTDFHLLNIKVYDLRGSLCHELGNETFINTESYSAGIYIIEIIGVEGIVRKKFVKI